MVSVTKIPSGATSLISKIFKLKIIYFFLAILLINAVVIAIEEKDIRPALEDLGEKFLFPTLYIQNWCLETIENWGIYQRTPRVLNGIWDMVLSVFRIITQFYILLAWVTLLAGVVSVSPFSNRSMAFVNWSLGIGIFVVIQMLAIASTNKGSIMTPIFAFWDFLRAIPYIVKPVTEAGMKFVGKDITGNASV